MRQSILLWGLVALTSALLAAGAVVAWISPSGVVDLFGLMPGSGALLAVVFAPVGLLIAYHRPRHPIGWMMLVAGSLAAYGFLAGNLQGYVLGPDRLASLDYSDDTFLSSAPFSALLLDATAFGALRGVEAMASLVILLFPDGRVPSRKWRPVAWLIPISAVLLSGAIVVGSFPVRTGRADLTTVLAIAGVGSSFGPIVGVLVATGLFIRYRRSNATHRLQLKWLLYSLVLGVGYAVFSGLVNLIPGFDNSAGSWLDSVLIAILFASVPVVIAIAILSHRLYDIDLVINRTLVYGLLTLTLGAVFVAGVVGIPLVAPLGEQSDLAVAGSTLVVAALFNPMRRRLQAVVDRRFYRSRYDARQTVDSFVDRLRRDAELSEIEADLADAVGRTVHPSSVGVWIRDMPDS